MMFNKETLWKGNDLYVNVYIARAQRYNKDFIHVSCGLYDLATPCLLKTLK